MLKDPFTGLIGLIRVESELGFRFCCWLLLLSEYASSARSSSSSSALLPTTLFYSFLPYLLPTFAGDNRKSSQPTLNLGFWVIGLAKVIRAPAPPWLTRLQLATADGMHSSPPLCLRSPSSSSQLKTEDTGYGFVCRQAPLSSPPRVPTMLSSPSHCLSPPIMPG